MDKEIRVAELNHENIPAWVGKVEGAWRFYVRSFFSVRLNSFTSHEACEARLADGDNYILWHTNLPSQKDKIFQTDKWYHCHGAFYGRSSYLREIPEGVRPCARCLAVKSWTNAAESLKLETMPPICIETVGQFRDMDGFDPFNRYVFALKDIYFSHFGLTGSGCTLKTLDRRRLLRGRVKTIVEELLALGIVTLHPSAATKTVYVEYNEKVDIATALEVLSWYGKLRIEAIAE